MVAISVIYLCVVGFVEIGIHFLIFEFFLFGRLNIEWKNEFKFH